MSDELNPYPGNMKRHRVEPLLSDEDVEIMASKEASNWSPLHRRDAADGASETIERVRDIYESARAKDAELIQTLFDAGNTMRQWLGLTLQMDGESCPDCKYDWGKGHNAGCYQQRHLEAIEAWDAATQGFKLSEQ